MKNAHNVPGSQPFGQVPPPVQSSSGNGGVSKPGGKNGSGLSTLQKPKAGMNSSPGLGALTGVQKLGPMGNLDPKNTTVLGKIKGVFSAIFRRKWAVGLGAGAAAFLVGVATGGTFLGMIGLAAIVGLCVYFGALAISAIFSRSNSEGAIVAVTESGEVADKTTQPKPKTPEKSE